MTARGSDYEPAFFSLRCSLLSPSGQLPWRSNNAHTDDDRLEGLSLEEEDAPRRTPKYYRLFVQLFPVPFACQASGVEPGDLFRGKLLFQEFIVLTCAAAQHQNYRLS